MPSQQPPKKTVFCFDHYRLTHDEFVLLQDVTFTIAEHESVAIVGPTGSGKSLLLAVMQQSLWGTLPRQRRASLWHEQGQLHVLGHPCAPTPPDAEALRHIHSEVAYLRESSVWLPISIAENFAAVQKLAGHTAIKTYEEIVEDFAQSARNRALLVSLAEQMPSQIEAPYLQYLAIIRAFVRRPKVILLDEALIRLDPILLRHAETLLYEYTNKTTMVWATNDLHQASRMTDRTLLLLGGRLWEDSETTAFFANPRTLEAEAFISGREGEWNV